MKGPNVLVRPEGQPVLVDFGVSTWPEASRVTGPLPPGSWPYRSPEVWRFLRERQPGERYTASALDDLWALGIALYRLLTGAYPFDERDEPSQQDAVLTHHPAPPHERNVRVPRALGELCLRLLDKAPEARFPSATALEAALTEALAGADEAWDVPLRDERAPEDAPEEAPTPQPSTLAAPATTDEALPAQSQAPTGTRPPHGAFRRWAWGALALVSMAQVMLALLLATRTPSPPPSSPSAPPPESWHLSALQGVEAFGQEVAPPWQWPEGGRGTAPLEAATPVPVASATRPQDMRVKTPKAPPASQLPPHEKQTGTSASKVGTALLACALASGCPGAQVRPVTADDCPPGAQEAMKNKWGFLYMGTGYFRQEEQGLATVRKGPGATIHLSDTWGFAPAGTELTGELFFGDERVYGRFTQARIRGGDPFPICVQLRANDDTLGLPILGRPAANTALVEMSFLVEAVAK